MDLLRGFLDFAKRAPADQGGLPQRVPAEQGVLPERASGEPLPALGTRTQAKA
jgi:hypothetical protein